MWNPSLYDFRRPKYRRVKEKWGYRCIRDGWRDDYDLDAYHAALKDAPRLVPPPSPAPLWRRLLGLA